MNWIKHGMLITSTGSLSCHRLSRDLETATPQTIAKCQTIGIHIICHAALLDADHLAFLRKIRRPDSVFRVSTVDKIIELM